MHLKLLLIVLFQSAFTATIPECHIADVISFDAKYKKFNEEMMTVLKNETPDNASVKVLLGHCEELLKEGEALKCYVMEDVTVSMKKTCQRIGLLVGPSNECSKKMRSLTTLAECATWFNDDTNKINVLPEELCAGFRQRKDCIQKEVGKICGAEAEKQFKENESIIEEMMGCVLRKVKLSNVFCP